MSNRKTPVDDRERAVVDLWRKGHLCSGTIQIYLQWVRRFRAFCESRKLDEGEHLTRKASGALSGATPVPDSEDGQARLVVVVLRTTRCTLGLAHCARW